MTAKECQRALGRHRLQVKPGLCTWLSVHVESLRTEVVVATLRLISWWSTLGFGRKPKPAAVA